MKHKNIEELVKDADGIRANSERYEEKEVYVPKHDSFFDDLKRYWYGSVKFGLENSYAMPGGELIYYLYKLPPGVHKILNKTLYYATPIVAALGPEASLASGLFYSLSEVIYGVKTNNGKNIISGLIGSLTHLKLSKDPKLQKFAAKSLDKLEELVQPLLKKKPA